MTNSEAAKCVEYIRFYMEGGECWTDAEFEAMDMAIEALRSATDINVATKEPEIVHCRDCRHWKNDHLCESLSRYGTFETKNNFYCGFAEKREG